MLSIIIPTLNEGRYLPLLLNEIKKQKFSDCEIIVADADSIDKTVEIAKSFGCIVVKGGPVARGRNEGAKMARGETILFMDADNIYLPPNFFEKLLKQFKKRDLAAAYFPILINGNKTDKLIYGIYNWWTEITQNFFPHAFNSILVKKEIHQKMGGFDEDIKIGEDHEYVRRAAKFGRFGFIKMEPVLTSSRRLEQDGRIRTYLRYLLGGIYMIFFGPIKSDIFKYRFNHLDTNKK